MIVFDLEADGLPHDVSKIHCMVLYNTEEDSYGVFNDQGTGELITRAITLIEEADRVAGHNIINYDLRVIKNYTHSLSHRVRSSTHYCCLNSTTLT